MDNDDLNYEKNGWDLKDRESIINTIYNTTTDYIPVLLEPNSYNKFEVFDRIGLCELLKIQNDWSYDYLELGGWGYNTPVIEIIFKNEILWLKEINIFIPFVNDDFKLKHNEVRKNVKACHIKTCYESIARHSHRK